MQMSSNDKTSIDFAMQNHPHRITHEMADTTTTIIKFVISR